MGKHEWLPPYTEVMDQSKTSTVAGDPFLRELLKQRALSQASSVILAVE